MSELLGKIFAFFIFIGLLVLAFLLNFIFYGGVIALIAFAIYFLVKALGLV